MKKQNVKTSTAFLKKVNISKRKRRMLATELSLKVNFKGRFKSKTVYQKSVFRKYWKWFFVKSKKNIVNYAPTTSQIKIYGRFFLKR